MATIVGYNGCKAYVYDEHGHTIAIATIMDHNTTHMTIVLNCKLDEKVLNGAVTVLILDGDTVREYRGKARRLVTNPLATQISLFQGRKKESRRERRFYVNTIALVDSLIIEQNTLPLMNPIRIHLVNLSSSGALIQTAANCFSPKAILSMKIDIGGNQTALRAKIVWSKDLDSSTSQYGCKFIAAQ